MATTALHQTPTTTQTIVDALLEVRHELNPRFLDNRGRITEELRSALKLEDIGVGVDGISLANSDESERAFVTMKNAGLELHDASSANVFADRCVVLLRTLADARTYRNKNELDIRRLGIRGRFLFEYDGTFRTLKDNLVETFGAPSAAALTAFGGRIKDVQYTYVVDEEANSANIHIGPMRDTQIVDFFKRDDDYILPAVGLYVDVDVFKVVTGIVTEAQLQTYIRQFSAHMWDKAHAVRAVAFGA